MDSQKISFEFLKSHLWSAADILRGSLDSSEYRQPVMTLLFLKRLNDTFEENAENLINKGINKKEAYNKRRHNFYIPKNARWTILSSSAENIGEKIDDVCRIIEREKPKLEGVLTNTKYNDKSIRWFSYPLTKVEITFPISWQVVCILVGRFANLRFISLSPPVF